MRTREEFNSYYRKYYKKNKEKIRKQRAKYQKDYSKKWQERNREKTRDYSRQYRAKYPERVREQRRKWAKEHPEKIKEYHKKYRIKYGFKWRTERGCLNCGKIFLPNTSNQKYCSECSSKHNKSVGRWRLRFEIFKRDNFTCQYCGRKAPEVELQIDHKHPKSKGGKDRIENYITACKECNMGKGDVLLKEEGRD